MATITKLDIVWRKSGYGYKKTLTKSVQIWRRGDLFGEKMCIDRALTVGAALRRIRHFEQKEMEVPYGA